MFRFQSVFAILLLNVCYAAQESSTLRQSHVVFRHGDRNPDAESMYPKDPYLNISWYPNGLGGLTMVILDTEFGLNLKILGLGDPLGRQEEYKIGKALRKEYNTFLGSIYTPDILDPWSTDYARTKMSLELVLAGLWPPAPSQIWNSLLLWQPIPYNYIAMENDKILGSPIYFCPKYETEYNEVSKLDEFDGFLKSNADLIQYIDENSGLEIKSLYNISVLYFGLYAEEKTNHALPTWTKKVYPGFLKQGTLLCYKQQVYNDVLKKYSGGHLLKYIIDKAHDKINGTLQPKKRKLFLYSGHEYNIVHLLAALNLYKVHIPPYASYISVELHKIIDTYGFKIFYQDYKQKKPQLMQIPGCESFCPFEKLIELTKNVVPEDYSC